MKDREAWCTAVHGVTELDMTERLKLTDRNEELDSNWLAGGEQ